MSDKTNEEVYNVMLDAVVSCSLKYGFLTAYTLSKEASEFIWGVGANKEDVLLSQASNLLKELESKGYVRNNGSVYEQIKGFDNSEFIQDNKPTTEEERGL